MEATIMGYRDIRVVLAQYCGCGHGPVHCPYMRLCKACNRLGAREP